MKLHGDHNDKTLAMSTNGPAATHPRKKQILITDMTLIVDENVKLEPTSEQFAVPLFHVAHNNRKHLSEFLPWIEEMQYL